MIFERATKSTADADSGLDPVSVGLAARGADTGSLELSSDPGDACDCEACNAA